MESFNEYEPPITTVPFHRHNKFHVFLSFRGVDVRKTLIDNLYRSLCTEGLAVFLDSEELEKGKSIDPALQKAIESSDILIPIFSKGYADSSWCLREAAQMCCSRNAFIIPLFYDVQPCHVRHPDREGSPYAKAFEKHLHRHDIHTIDEWKKALVHISSRSGWSLQAESGYEGRLIQTIVRDLLNTLKNVPLVVAEYPVGLEKAKEDLIQNLNLSLSCSVVKVGICGIGGIGKTALAKAVYNEIHRLFDAACFVFNVRDSASMAASNTGLVELQRRIMKDLINYSGEVPSVDHGKSMMRDHLRGVRALVILDDVDHKRQLDALCGDWYAPGSRVIISSRDEHIVNVGKVDSVLEMSGLGEEAAVELFCWHAFSRASPEIPYKELSTRIAQACRGHPLSLEVIGAHLYDKKAAEDIKCWEEALHNVATSTDIFRVLKVSYDSLTDVEKEIFLDIACFFIGERKRDCIIYWDALHKNKAETTVKNLSLKLLIKTSGSEYPFEMHDLLRDMGREIVKQAGNQIRLWLPSDARTILNRDGREGVISSMLSYKGQKGREPINFPSMPGLRYLFLQNILLVGNIEKLAPNLIWLKLRSCELVTEAPGMEVLYRWLIKKRRIQSIGNWSQLRILSIEDSLSPAILPHNLGSLSQLKHLGFHGCTRLTSLPTTMGNLEQLQRLVLSDCTRLWSLPDTLGNMTQLRCLYLDGCASLRRLPNTMCSLAHLQQLNLHGCVGIKSLQNAVGNLAQLQMLNLSLCSSLENLPHIIGNLTQLQWLVLHGCTGLRRLPNALGNLAQLQQLNLSGCARLRSIPNTIGNMVQLQQIYISGCETLENLPHTMGNLVRLQSLDLSRCVGLENLPDMVGNLTQLEVLVLSGCTSLNNLPDTMGNLGQLKHLNLSGCKGLEILPNTIGNLVQLQQLYMRGCIGLRSLPDTMGSLTQLQWLILSDCVGLGSLPNTMGNLAQLQWLILCGCTNLGSLPNTLEKLIHLRWLILTGCDCLRSLPDMVDNEDFPTWRIIW